MILVALWIHILKEKLNAVIQYSQSILLRFNFGGPPNTVNSVQEF